MPGIFNPTVSGLGQPDRPDPTQIGQPPPQPGDNLPGVPAAQGVLDKLGGIVNNPTISTILPLLAAAATIARPRAGLALGTLSDVGGVLAERSQRQRQEAALGQEQAGVSQMLDKEESAGTDPATIKLARLYNQNGDPIKAQGILTNWHAAREGEIDPVAGMTWAAATAKDLPVGASASHKIRGGETISVTGQPRVKKGGTTQQVEGDEVIGGERYPSMTITTTDNDGNVVSKKTVAQTPRDRPLTESERAAMQRAGLDQEGVPMTLHGRLGLSAEQSARFLKALNEQNVEKKGTPQSLPEKIMGMPGGSMGRPTPAGKTSGNSTPTDIGAAADQFIYNSTPKR